MPQINRISIPTPCHELWQEMTPVEKGRRCQSCCKTVIDFTVMSNAEVINYLALHKNTCGRVEVQKLASINNQLDLQNRKQFSWKGLFAAVSLGMLLPVMEADAQALPKTEQAPVDPPMLGKMVAIDTANYLTIKGVVKAKDDGLPVPGALVKIKDTGIGIQANLNGAFTLRAPLTAISLTVSSPGYISMDVPIRKLNDKPEILMDLIFESSALVTTGIVAYAKRPPFYKRWWYRLKNIF